MANPPHFSLFQHEFLTGDKPLLNLDAEFLRNHTKVLLRSDKSDRVWKVELDGDRLAGGWEEFAAVHNFRDGDGLVFRHDGDENFHVSVPSRSISGDIQHTSPSYVDTEIDDDDVDSTDDDDVVYDGDEDNIGNISAKKNKKPEEDSSSGHSCFITASVTHYSLQSDRLDLSKDFKVVSFGDNYKPREIDLVNEQGRRWTLRLAKNSSTGVFYIRQGWQNFCFVNKISQGDICKFKLVENGKGPVLWLCPQEFGNGHGEEEKEEADAMKNFSLGGCSKEKRTLGEVSKGKEKKTHSPFLTLKFTPSRYKTGQLYISSEFTRKNGIEKSGEIILLNKDGRKWSSYLQMTGSVRSGSEWFYLRRGWREMCEANGVKVNDSFVLQLIWENANPMFKFFSKIENKGKGNQRIRKKRACETNVEKTPREEIEGRANKRVSRRPEHQEDETRGLTRALNRTIANSRKSCSVSDQVTNVKRGIVDTLNTVRQFRAELEIREQNLEASLLEIDALGERILGISKILNNTLV